MDAKDILLSEESLFKDDGIFNPEHIPDQFMFREPQLKEMTFALKPGMRGGRPSNAFLLGNPATGKTTAVKIVFEQLKESTNKIIPVYVNCHLNSSPYKIFSEIMKAVKGMPPPDSGVPITKVQEDVFSKLSKTGKLLVVALDDFDFLITNNTANDVLYYILRAHESYPGALTGVFAIGIKDSMHALDPRTRSIFSPVRISFSPYSSGEIRSVLKRRCDAGLYANVMSNVILGKITERTTDLRFGIELVKQAVLAAEADACRKVEERHLEKALKSMEPPETSKDKIFILDIVRKKGEVDSGELFELVRKEKGISYTTLYRMLKRMETAGLLGIEHKTKGKGKTSLIRAL